MTESTDLIFEEDIRSVWDVQLHILGCQHCGVAHLVPASWELSRCPACLRERLESQPVRWRREPPELLVPFESSLTDRRLSKNVERWLRGVWLRPDELRADLLLSRLRRVFVPMWLVDATVVGHWSAQMGYDYQVESTLERFEEGRGWRSRRLEETRTRWEPRAGRVNRRYENVPVPALEASEEVIWHSRVGSYALDAAVAYTADDISEAAVRAPSLLPEDAWPIGRSKLEQSVWNDCQRAADAQHSEEFSLGARYEGVNWTQLLLPLYVSFYYDDGGNALPVWINGQSGQIGGVRRASTRKAWWAAGAIVAVSVITLVLGLAMMALDVEDLGVVIITAGFFLGLLTVLPLVWAWQFNRREGAGPIGFAE
jgi:hypothetical protein